MQALPKAELKRQMKRFIADKDRGISLELFCQVAGISKVMFLEVFARERQPLTEYVQSRVNKAYIRWKAGQVKVMKRIDNTRYVAYRREPEVPLMPQMGLKMTSEGIKLRVGIVNRHDYSEMGLKESIRG